MVAAKKKHGSSNETSTSVAQTKKICNRCLTNIYQCWYLFYGEQRIWVHRNGCFMLTIVHRKNQEHVIVMSRFARNFGGSKDDLESFKRRLINKSHKINEFFEQTAISFYRQVYVHGKKYSENFDQHDVITVNNVSDLIEKIILKRNISKENIFGLDGGSGFMKICQPLFDLDEKAPSFSQRVGKTLKTQGLESTYN